MDELVKVALNYGFPGLACVVLVVYVKQLAARLDKAMNDLVTAKEVHVADVKGFTTVVLDLQGKLLAAVDKISEVSKNRGNP